MISNIKIISDGTACNAQILADGVPLRGVTKIEFAPFEANSILHVTFTVEGVQLDIDMDNITLKSATK